MTLVVEDGTIVANANSYASETEIIAFNTARGITIPNNAAAEQAATKAMDYMDTLTIIGEKVDWETQTTLMPRDGMHDSEGNLLPNDEVPVNWKKGFMALCGAIYQGYNPLMTITQSNQVVQETFGPFSVTYKDNASVTPMIQLVDAYLTPFIANGNFYISGVTRSYG